MGPNAQRRGLYIHARAAQLAMSVSWLSSSHTFAARPDLLPCIRDTQAPGGAVAVFARIGDMDALTTVRQAAAIPAVARVGRVGSRAQKAPTRIQAAPQRSVVRRVPISASRSLQVCCSLEQGALAADLSTPEAKLAQAGIEMAKMEEALRCTRMAAMVCRLGQVLGRNLDFARDAGQGAFADVAFVTDTETGEEMAVKLAQGEENMDLLDRESEALKYLNGLEGSGPHVIQMLHPYVQFELSLGTGGVESAGAIVLESADCDLDHFVTEQVRNNPSLDTMQTVAKTLNNWEESLGWLHGHGILHLDIKAENAVLCSKQDGAVKIIDLTGMLTRSHSASGDDMSVPAEELLWETTRLHKLGIPYVSTETYVQPEEAGPAARIIDYSADWWSMGISKVEILGLHPALFEIDEGTGDIVLESLASGNLDDFMRVQLGELLEEEPESETVSLWADSVMTNLQGLRSEAPVTVNLKTTA